MSGTEISKCVFFSSSALRRQTIGRAFLLIFATGVALNFGAADAYAGPCTAKITQLQQKISRDKPGPAAGPTSTQSVNAQLHHQPTPGSVQQAQSKADADAAAALNRARQADANGDATACSKALDEVKQIYAID
jgi:hypothetical protein